MRNQTIRFHTFLILLLLLACGLPGCSPEPEQASVERASEPRAGGRLVVALQNEPDTLNPLLMRLFDAAQVLGVLHHGMVRMNEEMEFVPGLAESWAWSEDGDVLDLHLRPGLVWSDGTPFAAYDVVSSYELYDHDDSPFHQQSLFNVLENVTALDDHHVRLAFVAKIPDRIQRAVLDPLPRHAASVADLAEVTTWKINRTPVTLGPYRMVEWTAGQRLVVERNPHYYGRPAYIDEIEFRFVPDVNNRLLQLETGEVSLLTTIPHHHVDRLREKKDIELHATADRRVVYLLYNQRLERLADARVRRAISLAVDRRAMVDGLLYGYGQPAASPFPPLLWPFDASLAPDELDRERAAALLDAAGWVDSDGDGVRDREGTDLAVSLVTAVDPVRENVAIVVRDNLAEIGIDVKVEVMELGAAMGSLRSGEFEIALVKFASPVMVDPATYLATDGPANFGGYSNASLDALIEEGRRAESREAAIPVWHRFQKLFHEEQPWTTLFYPANLVGTRRVVRDATPNFLSALYGVENWWLEPEGD